MATVLLAGDILQYFMMGVLLEVSLDVVAVQLHDVGALAVLEDVDRPEVFVLDALDEMQLFLNLLVSIPHLDCYYKQP